MIDVLRSHGPAAGEDASLEALHLADEAVERFPRSAKLWCMRGDLIQLGSGESHHELEDALRSYQRAAEADPDYAAAWESLGYYYDVITNELEAAERMFRRAVHLNGSPESWAGLARVLAERGVPVPEVLATLAGCPYSEHSKIIEIRGEIAEGGWEPIE